MQQITCYTINKLKSNYNKTNVIRADLMAFDLDLNFDFEDIFRFCDILVFITFPFW